MPVDRILWSGKCLLYFYIAACALLLQIVHMTYMSEYALWESTKCVRTPQN
jgi:hypothetical protein